MKKSLITLAAAAALSSSVLAAPIGDIYTVVSLSYASADTNYKSDTRSSVEEAGLDSALLSSSESKNKAGLKAIVGWQFNDYIALENGLVYLGKSKAKSKYSDTDIKQSFTNDAWGYVFDALATYPVTEDIKVFGKAGFGVIRTTQKITIDTAYGSGWVEGKKTRFVPKLGLGADYRINDNLAIRAEYEHYFKAAKAGNYSYTDVNYNVFSLGLKYTF